MHAPDTMGPDLNLCFFKIILVLKALASGAVGARFAGVPAAPLISGFWGRFACIGDENFAGKARHIDCFV
jgi:hypothetical protein